LQSLIFQKNSLIPTIWDNVNKKMKYIDKNEGFVFIFTFIDRYKAKYTCMA